MEALKNVTLRVAGIIEESIVDGPGLRFVLFLQGCRTHCKGCQNPQTWDFDGGTLVSAEDILSRVQCDPLVHGITFSGGEPFEQATALLPLAEELKRRGYHLMAFSGYTLNSCFRSPGVENCSLFWIFWWTALLLRRKSRWNCVSAALAISVSSICRLREPPAGSRYWMS